MRPEEAGRLVLGTAPIVDQGSAPEDQRLGSAHGQVENEVEDEVARGVTWK